MSARLASVVCLCYNHAKYVEEAIQSVLNQTHPAVQLIVVDDASTDNSVEVIKEVIQSNPSIQLIASQENLGNCKAFNKGLAHVRGDFVIDLSADDVLMPERIQKGIEILESHGKAAGVTFSDAILINEAGEQKGLHSDRFPHDTIPQGNIYSELLSKYFINSPTMMMRREVFEELGGYDEHLAYEDFDFWIRSSRKFNYYYTPLPLVKRRILPSSLGKGQYRKAGKLMRSTFIVCEKALALNQDQKEHNALKKRVQYESRKALFAGDMRLFLQYIRLYRRIP